MADTPQILRWINQTQNPSGADEQAFLSQVHAYDPNASYVYDPNMYQTGEGIYAGGYRLNTDYSKLPATGMVPGASSLANELVYDNVTPSINFTGRDQAYDVVDPSKITHSSVYGDIMPVGNQAYRETAADRMFRAISLAAVGGFAAGIPALAGAMTGGAAGAAGAAGAGFDFGAGAAGTDAGNAAGLSGLGPGFDFGAGAAGTDAGNASGLLNTSGFDFGAGAAGTDAGNAAGLNNAYGMYDRSLGLSGTDDAASNYGMHDRSLGTSNGGSLYDGTQPAAPISDQGTPARVGDVLRNGGVPGLDNIAQSLRELGLDPSKLLQAATGVAGAAPGGGGGFGGGGGGGGMGGGGEDAVAIIRRFYGQDALSKLKGQAHG